jgi:hypothetical protein
MIATATPTNAGVTVVCGYCGAIGGTCGCFSWGVTGVTWAYPTPTSIPWGNVGSLEPWEDPEAREVRLALELRALVHRFRLRDRVDEVRYRRPRAPPRRLPPPRIAWSAALQHFHRHPKGLSRSWT